MSLRKGIIAGLLAAAMLVEMLPMQASAKVTPQDVQTPELVTSFQSVGAGSPMRQIEYYDITTDGMKLTVSGKTAEKYVQYRVSIRPLNSKTYLFWHYYGGENNSFGEPESDGSFSKTLDFTKEGNGNPAPNGDYLLSVRFNKDGSDKFEDEAQMRYIPIVKNSQGVFIKRFNAIEEENARVIAGNTRETKEYMDTSMADMAHELRNGREYSQNDITSLTKSQQKTIAEFTQKVVGGETDSYKQLLKIHDYLCNTLYYDIPYNDASQATKREMAKSGRVTLNPYDLVKSMESGAKTRTVCNGFSALYAAMTRSLGIPCRTARGTALRIPGMSWENMSAAKLNAGTHVWNEAYVNGRWVFVDTTKDCPNDFTTGGQYKRLADKLVKRCGFDASIQSVGVYTLYTSYREEENTLPTPKLTSASSKKCRVTLRWKKVKGAVRYYVFRSTDGMKYSLVKKISPKELTYKSGKLKKGKKYYWRIRAVMEDDSFSNFSNYKVVKVK